ncbi:DnaJ family domain-containing protein [Salinifilum aidingensis]
MTERKPPNLDFESWVDRQIREAAERGELDDLPGAGQPLRGLHKNGEAWWIKERVQREGISAEELLPAPLRLRKEVERLPEAVRDLPDEQAVREEVAALNRRIAAELSAPTGPRVRLAPVDADELVRQWREQRTRPERSRPEELRVEEPRAAEPRLEESSPAERAAAEDRAPWWRRALRLGPRRTAPRTGR